MGIPKKTVLYKIALGMLIFLCSFSNGFSQEKTLQNNYIQGVLPNKLQFFVQKNNPKKAETLFYLLLKTGSIQENNNELGYAHFLEHMAFKGGKRFSKKPFTQFLKEQGLQIGVHYNAVTHYDYTLYEVTVPQKASITLQKQIFSFFADIIDGLTLHQKDIETEKKIVLAEKEVTPELQKHFLFKLGNSLYANRSPIGTEVSISSITTKKLKNFYNKWYQPKNAGIFVVGNINPKQTAELMQQVFGKIKNTTKHKKIKTNLYKRLTNGVSVNLDTTKTKNRLHIELALKHKVKSKKEEVAVKIFKKILQKRIDTILKSNIRIYDDYFLSNVNYFSISSSIKKEIPKIVSIILSEIKRIAVFGVSKKELDFYLNEGLKDKKENPTFSNHYIAKKLTNYFFGISSINTKKYSGKLSAKIIKKIAGNLYDKSKKRIFIELKKKSNKELNNQWFIGLIEGVSNKKLKNIHFKLPKKEEVKKTKVFLETPYLSATSPIYKKHYPKLNITKVIYKNGIEVLLKPLPNQEKEIRVLGYAEGGTSFLTDELYPQYESTVSYMDLGGVGNLKYDDLEHFLEDKNMGLSLNMMEYQRSFFGFTENKYKDDFFKYLYLKLTVARKNQKEFNKIIADEIAEAKKESQSKSSMMSSEEEFKIAELSGTYFPDRKIAETINDYKKLNLDKMGDFYRRSFSYSNDWKVIVVGDFDVDEVMLFINRCLGGLKKTSNPLKNRNLFNQNKFKNNYTFKSKRKVKTTANTLLFYSTYKKGLKNTLLQSLFKMMLQDNVTFLLREKHGIVYTPTVELEKQLGFSVFKIGYNCNPNNTEKAKQILINRLSNLDDDKISNFDFQSYKNQLLLKYRSIINSKSSYDWAFSLQNSFQNKDTVTELENYEAILDNITLNEFYEYISKNFNVKTLKVVSVVPN